MFDHISKISVRSSILLPLTLLPICGNLCIPCGYGRYQFLNEYITVDNHHHEAGSCGTDVEVRPECESWLYCLAADMVLHISKLHLLLKSGDTKIYQNDVGRMLCTEPIICFKHLKMENNKPLNQKSN